MSINPVIQEALDDLTEIFPDAETHMIERTKREIESNTSINLYELLRLIALDLPGGDRALRDPREVEPITPLGRLALQFDTSLFSQSPFDINFRSFTCPEAEAFYLQSLARAAQRTPEKASAVIYTQDSVPVAYRKHIGQKTVLLLREADVLPGIPPGTCLAMTRDNSGIAEDPTKNNQLVTAELDKEVGILSMGSTIVNILRPLTFALKPLYISRTKYRPPVQISTRSTEPDYASKAKSTGMDDVIVAVDELYDTFKC